VGLTRASTLAGILLLLSCAPAGDTQQRHPAFEPLRDSLQRHEPQPIYDPDPSHPWNRVFHLLFTRTVETRLGAIVPGPVFAASDERTALSNRTVRRVESGDRAIDPLYPAWVWLGGVPGGSTDGADWVLRDPQYSDLGDALEAVASTASKQSALARALMQADLWAAYDVLHASLSRLLRPSSDRASNRPQRAERMLDLLAAAIRALALTRSEIGALPATFAAARSAQGLPDLFNPRSGWIEIRWFDSRMHERDVQDRRAARVFFKPSWQPTDVAAFLARFRDGQGAHSSALEAAALVIQNLLIASDGTVVPSPIMYDVQLRRFDARSASDRPAVLQYELSRQMLLGSPETGGLRPLDQDAPAYLPSAGNDLSFATPSFLRPGAAPLLVPLRQRCASCHGPRLDHLFTFSRVTAPGVEPPRVVALDASQHRHAWDVAARKMASESWKALERQWTNTR
jgi:hypothetical protein